jgi:S1-C subfamily serine protease
VPRRLVRAHRLAADTGVLILTLESGGPARQAGLAEGDVIVGYNEHPVTNIDDLHRLLIEEAVGRTSTLTVLRGVDLMARDIVPQAMPQLR